MADTVSFVLKAAVGQIFPSLIALLKKGQAHAKTIDVEESVMLNARLAPDMFPLTRQIQIATDITVRGGSRLASVTPPAFPDTEETFDQLIDRVSRAKDYVLGLDDSALNASALRNVTFPIGPDEMTMPGQQYLMSMVLANMYFHSATAYNLLRHNGVQIGKRDYLAG